MLQFFFSTVVFLLIVLFSFGQWGLFGTLGMFQRACLRCFVPAVAVAFATADWLSENI
jgi:hypothetical protein